MNKEMTIAEKIAANALDSYHAAFSVESEKYDIDQDWENEATIYTFEDGSKLTISTVSVTAE
jgi:hypothetical protein